MAKYRKKPVVIEAVQWTGDNLRDIIDFTGLHESAKKWTWEEYEKVVALQGLKIFTLEGPSMQAPAITSSRAFRASSIPASRTSLRRHTSRSNPSLQQPGEHSAPGIKEMR